MLNDIGHKIKCIRKENNLNQVQFAKSIGISQGNLSEIELGNSNPSAETLLSIRTQYNVSLNWLLTGVNAEDGTTYEDEFERRLIEVYRNLDDYDKNEIIEFIRVKIQWKVMYFLIAQFKIRSKWKIMKMTQPSEEAGASFLLISWEICLVKYEQSTSHYL